MSRLTLATLIAISFCFANSSEAQPLRRLFRAADYGPGQGPAYGNQGQSCPPNCNAPTYRPGAGYDGYTSGYNAPNNYAPNDYLRPDNFDPRIANESRMDQLREQIQRLRDQQFRNRQIAGQPPVNPALRNGNAAGNPASPNPANPAIANRDANPYANQRYGAVSRAPVAGNSAQPGSVSSGSMARGTIVPQNEAATQTEPSITGPAARNYESTLTRAANPALNPNPNASTSILETNTQPMPASNSGVAQAGGVQSGGIEFETPPFARVDSTLNESSAEVVPVTNLAPVSDSGVVDDIFVDDVPADVVPAADTSTETAADSVENEDTEEGEPFSIFENDESSSTESDDSNGGN